jgi:hypothetical protein
MGDDDFERRQPTPPIDTSAAAQQRTSAQERARQTIASPEWKDLIDDTKLLEEQLDATIKITNQREKQLVLERAIALATERTTKAMDKARQGNAKEFRRLAQQTNQFDPATGYIVPDASNPKGYTTMTEKQFEEAVKRGDDPRIKGLQKTVEGRLAGRRGGLDAAESPGFKIGELMSALSRGDIGHAMAEIMQPFGGSGGLGARMAARGEAMKTAEGAGRMARMGGGALGMLSRFMGPAGLIAGQQIWDRVISPGIRTGQEAVRQGQVTGEGFGAGMASRAEALRLAGNPFDMLDRRTAGEIVAGVRGKGFRGELGRALQDSVGTVFKDLGTDWQESLEMLNTVVKSNIMSVEDFTEMMTGLDDVAKNANISVAAAQANLKGLMDTFGAQAGATAAQQISTPGLQEFFKGTQVLQDKRLGDVLGVMLPRAASMLGGVAQPFAAGAAAADPAKYLAMLTDKLWQIRQQNPQMTDAMFAQFLANTPMGETFGFGGLGALEIEQMLKVMFKNRGREAQAIRGPSIKAQIGTAREDLKDGKQESGGKRGFGWAFESGAGGWDGTLNRFKGERRYIEELKDSMTAAGMDQAEIDRILKPIRDPVNNARGRSMQERRDLFEERKAAVEKDYQRSYQIGLTPEASKLVQTMDSKRQDYIMRGKNSQGTNTPLAPKPTNQSGNIHYYDAP